MRDSSPLMLLAVAPAVTMDEAFSLLWYLDREDASSTVTASAMLTPQKGRVALGNQDCCVHIHTENLSGGNTAAVGNDKDIEFTDLTCETPRCASLSVFTGGGG